VEQIDNVEPHLDQHFHPTRQIIDLILIQYRVDPTAADTQHDSHRPSPNTQIEYPS